jgi:3-hydroxy-9,10-secoandrosta-1,3,5(10)-triene-9,17-dione monooxygenase
MDPGSRAVRALRRDDTAGSAPARKGHRLQRYFNDVAMYRGHSSAQFANFAAGLARLHFGLPWGMYGL